MFRMTRKAILLLLSLGPSSVYGFSVQRIHSSLTQPQRSTIDSIRQSKATVGTARHSNPRTANAFELAASLDVDTIGLVVGQENYGLAAVCVGEAIWSFAQAPSMSNVKVLLPGVLAALVLGLVSGPMVTSGDTGSIGTGLFIATAVSIALGASYFARFVLFRGVTQSAKESKKIKDLQGFRLVIILTFFIPSHFLACTESPHH